MDYSGDVEPFQAYDVLKDDENSYLIDVRTLPEWSYVGIPNLGEIGKDVLRISWLIYPTMEVNHNFIEQLKTVIDDKDAKLFFLCKVGGRSLDAAIMAQRGGFKNCYNVSGGFEGKLNEHGHRGKSDGWKAQNLPWYQV